MIVRKAFKYRLYPNQAQQAKLAIQFGHARFTYNWALAARQSHYREHGTGLSYYDVKKMVTALKRDPEHLWLKDADSQVLQAKIEDLDRAFANFFAHRARYPKFKRRNDQQSIRYPQRFQFRERHIYLPKVGWVKVVFHRPFEGTPKNVTVSKAKSGEYYVSIQCEMERREPPPNGKPTVGVDLGLKHFVTLSTGEKIDHPHYYVKAQVRLKRLQRHLSRCEKSSRRWERARLLVARQQEHVARQRGDFLHKLSYRLVTNHGLVKLEDLNISGMLRNHKLPKHIADSGWGTFIQFCVYKAPWHGSATGQVDRFFPSSKQCHVRHFINVALTLADREWTCLGCGTRHDRDHNAAINIDHASTVGATERQRLGRDCKTNQPLRLSAVSLNREARS